MGILPFFYWLVEITRYYRKTFQSSINIKIMRSKDQILPDNISFKEFFLEKYKRMSAGMNVEDIAKKHDVTVSTIEKQIKMGERVEREHGVNIKKAKKIAMDHLAENPKYYTKLKKAKL
jgi:hypothetical protein